MNLSYVFEHGDTVLITTFLLLITMSLASWYVIFWKWWNVQKERSQLNHFKTRYMTAQDWPTRLGKRSLAGSHGLLVAAAETAAGHSTNDPKGYMEMHLAQTLDNIRTGMDKGLTILASVGTSAPFIGLFGTVWGVYNALTRIAAEGNASLNVVAGPMGEALVATAVGLFAAIPAVLAYNAFVRTNRVLVQDLRHIAEQLAAYHAGQASHDTAADKVKLVSGGQ